MTHDFVLPPLIAHRGASKVTPENTLIAFATAQQLGASWVEFDVMITHDQTVIVHHDETYERILGLNARVYDTAYAAIKTHDAGSWFAEKFSFVRIPTLTQTLSCCADLGLSVNIELKTTAEYAQQTAVRTLEILSKFKFFNPSNVLISSQEVQALSTFYQHAPTYRLGLVADHWADVESALNLDFELYSLNLHHAIITPEKMTQVQAQGYQVLAFTVNERSLAEQLFSLGVCSIFSDDVQLLNN
ncbi:MAG TPA: glycerophosphodiester phosphodiesterase family protein [Gammaproteobacteria bacterium]|nr:glycerophosphodiester phosphodiesterase family protein [Gammaproteobacteria bacterium]